MIGVYGSNGFLGKHLVRRLGALGLPTRAVSRQHDPTVLASVHGPVEFLEANFNDSLAMVASLADLDTVVQLISTSSPGLRNEHTTVDIQDNVLPHVAFLQSCIRAGVKRYVFLSSGGTVYGPSAPVPTPEASDTSPICSHGLTKLMVEKYIRMHGHVDGLDYVILRLANPYGPGQEFRKGQGLIPAIIDRSRRGLPIRVFGRGEARRDYVYIDDVIDGIIKAVHSQDARQQVINIGSGCTHSVSEVLDLIERISGETLNREYTEARSTDVMVSELDIRKAKELLGWAPSITFERGLRHTISGDRIVGV